MMTDRKCPFCGKEIDKRGYTQHVRKCREEDEKRKAEEIAMAADNEKEHETEEPQSKSTPNTGPDLKNSKPPTSITKKIIVSIAGMLGLVAAAVLMLIFRPSKESATKTELPATPSRRLRALQKR